MKQSIEDQHTKWHDEIDKFVNNLQNETDEMSDIQLKAPNKHLQKVKELCTKIQDTIKGNKDLLKSTNVTKTLSYKSKNSLLKCHPEEFEVSIPRFVSQPINGEEIAEIFGVIVGFSIMERREVLDILEWIPVKELFVQPKIQSVLETKMEYPGNIACHSEEKLWIVGNVGLLLNKNHSTLINSLMFCNKSSGATGASSTLKKRSNRHWCDKN